MKQAATIEAVSLKGAAMPVPAQTENRPVIVTGKGLKTASIKDADWFAEGILQDPDSFIASLRNSGVRADLFTFGQKMTDSRPHFPYHLEWDNVAAIPIDTYEEWWEKRVSHDLRKDVKRAEKRGLVVRAAEFNDDFVRGIKEVYDESPIRQGKPFVHYGKDLDAVRQANSSYLERSQFIGAYYQDELIGFIKTVYVDDLARMMQVISKDKDQDKRPANALIAKAVELAHERGSGYLTYGRYTYGNQTDTSLIQFKRRNGFEEIRFPRYYVPLSPRGAVALKAGLHLGLRYLIPKPLVRLLVQARSTVKGLRRRTPTAAEPAGEAAVANNAPAGADSK